MNRREKKLKRGKNKNNTYHVLNISFKRSALTMSNITVKNEGTSLSVSIIDVYGDTFSQLTCICKPVFMRGIVIVLPF